MSNSYQLTPRQYVGLIVYADSYTPDSDIHLNAPVAQALGLIDDTDNNEVIITASQLQGMAILALYADGEIPLQPSGHMYQ